MFLVGCGSKSLVSTEEKKTDEGYSYKRSTIAIDLPDDVNPYRVDYEEEGLYCYEQNQTQGEDGAVTNTFSWYYQEYSDSASVEIGKIDEYMYGFSGELDEEPEVAVLLADEETVIRKINSNGVRDEFVISDMAGKVSGFSYLYKLPLGEYAICNDSYIYIISDDGKKVRTVTLEDVIEKLIIVGDETYVLTYARDGMKKSLLKIDTEKCISETAFELDADLVNVFSFAEKLALIYQDSIVLVDSRGDNKEELLDLNKQAIFATKIAYIGGTKEAFTVVIDDLTETKQVICISMTRKTEEDVEIEQDKAKEQEQIQEKPQEKTSNREKMNRLNGEKVTVKVVVPADYYYNIEFHAKKYNQISDYSFIEIERLEESLEDYLGKGGTADIIMFNDNTEVPDYVQKHILTDLTPYMESYGDISTEDIIPVAKEIISGIDKDRIYVLATNFELLLMTSDGSERKDGKNSNIVEYLEQYDRFLTDRDIEGTGNIANFLFAIVPEYYNEESAETRFCEEEFKEIMRSYKTVRDNHPGILDIISLGSTYDRAVRNIINAPFWYDNYGSNQMAFAGYSFEGIPMYSGNSRIYARLDNPMGILESSAYKEEAYEFIEYYVMLNDYIAKNDSEEMNVDDGLTKTRLSIIQSIIDECIFNTDKPYLNVLWRLTMKKETLYYTKDNLDNLKRLLEDTTPVTKAQNDIYKMLLEEMEPFFEGGKDLDSSCEALNSRVRLYLMEKQ